MNTKEACLTPEGISVYYGNDMKKGYCWLHDREYALREPDDVCPQCLEAKELDLQWRNAAENDDE